MVIPYSGFSLPKGGSKKTKRLPPGTISYIFLMTSLLYLLCMPPRPLCMRMPSGPEGGGRREKRSLTRVFPRFFVSADWWAFGPSTRGADWIDGHEFGITVGIVLGHMVSLSVGLLECPCGRYSNCACSAGTIVFICPRPFGTRGNSNSARGAGTIVFIWFRPPPPRSACGTGRDLNAPCSACGTRRYLNSARGAGTIVFIRPRPRRGRLEYPPAARPGAFSLFYNETRLLIN